MGILPLLCQGELTERMDVFNSVRFWPPNDESGRKVPQSGIWDIGHHERGRRNCQLDHMLTLRLYNLNLTNYDIMELPDLRANLSTFSMSFNSLTNQGLGTLLMRATHVVSLDLRGET